MRGFLFFTLLLLITFVLVIQFKLPSRQNSLQDFNYPNFVNFKPGVQRLRDGTVEVSSLVNMLDVT